MSRPRFLPTQPRPPHKRYDWPKTHGARATSLALRLPIQ
jgi:hypothetical protein